MTNHTKTRFGSGLAAAVIGPVLRICPRRPQTVQVLAAGTVLPFVTCMLLVAVPTSANAQAVFPECMECGFSHYPGSEWISWACKFVGAGQADCAQWGSKHQHNCDAYGGACDSQAMGGPAEEQAVRMVIAGEMLPGDGSHYFITDGEMIFVKRKCDNYLVAQLYGDLFQNTMATRVSPLRSLPPLTAATDQQ